MGERRLVSTPVRAARLATFDSPEYWAMRPNRYDAHVRAYQYHLEFIWLSHWDDLDEVDVRLWDSAPNHRQCAAIAAHQ